MATAVVAGEAGRFLPGEDLAHEAEEIAGWIVIYEELASVLRSVITRSGDESETTALRLELGWVERRLAGWRERHARASGIVLDDGRALTHDGKTVRLTRREVELLDFLLHHPRRHFTTKELATLAWRSPWLSDAQVRTYLMRLRRRMREVGLDGMASLARSRGYGITRRQMRTEAQLKGMKEGLPS